MMIMRKLLSPANAEMLKIIFQLLLITLLMLAGIISFVEILQIKYLNNLVEQDHRFIKKITKPMMGFKAFYSAKVTIDGIETAH